MKTALAVIDVQRSLFDPEPQPYEAREVIDRINRLALAARATGSPVVFVQHERDGTPLEYGSDSWHLVEGLVVEAGDLHVRKRTPDSFLRTDLQTMLESQSVTRVVVAGYASEFCVDTTCRRAAALGYEVVLAANAHTTHDKGHATAAAIRLHENVTLPSITSFGPSITAQAAASVTFEA